MRSWGHTARQSVTSLVATGILVVLGCGPQAVPYPGRAASYLPNTAGSGAKTPQAALAGSSGADTSAAGSGGVAPPPAARGGNGASNEARAGRSGGAAGVPSSRPPFDAGDEPDRNRVAAGGLCQRLAEINCAAEAHCCEAPGRSVNECESELARVCSQDLYVDQVASNRISGFDAEAAFAMFNELEARASRCDLDIPNWMLTTQGFRGIFKGTVAPGNSCKPAGNLMDKPSQAAAIASCTGPGINACLPRSLLGDWTCTGKMGVGANCLTEDNCQADMFCNNPSMLPLGKCAQRVPLGASCINGTDCTSLYCEAERCVARDTQIAFCLK